MEDCLLETISAPALIIALERKNFQPRKDLVEGPDVVKPSPDADSAALARWDCGRRLYECEGSDPSLEREGGNVTTGGDEVTGGKDGVVVEIKGGGMETKHGKE